MSIHTAWRHRISIAVLASLLTFTAACGGGGSAATSSESSAGTSATGAQSFGLQPVESVAKLVPQELRDKGAIANAIYNDAAPQMFLQDGKLVGIQPDFAQAVSEVLGVKLDAIPVGSFDSIIPGLQSRRYDVAFADFGVTKEREKVVDFVYQFDLGTSFAVKRGSSLKIAQDKDLCGLTVATLAGSYFIPQVEAISKSCTDAGAEKVGIQTYPTQSAAVLAVANGRVDAYAVSSDQAAYAAQQTGAGITAQPFVYSPVPQGIGFPKGSKLAPAVAAALKELIKNGTYQKILAKWGIESSAISADEVTTSPLRKAS